MDPETVAARFVRWFGVSDIPTLDELTGLARQDRVGRRCWRGSRWTG